MFRYQLQDIEGAGSHELGMARCHRLRMVVIAAFSAWACAACGSGSPPVNGDPDAAVVPDGASDAPVPDATPEPDANGFDPGVSIVFPPSDALTDVDQVLIRGRLAMPGSGDIVAVEVNGVTAATEDGFASFQARIPLSLGTNTLAVHVRDSAGNQRDELVPMTITRVDAFIGRMDEIAFDRGNGRPLVIAPYIDGGRAVLSVDPSTGGHSVVSPLDAADVFTSFLDVDESRNRAVSAASDRIHAIDLATGASSQISGSGASFYARELAMDHARNRLFVVDGFDIIAVDMTTGTRTFFYRDAEPECGIRSADMDTVHDRLLIALDDCGGFELAPSLIGVQGENAIAALDPLTGVPTILSDDATGAGPMFTYPDRVVADPANDRAFVIDFLSNSLFSVDMATGDRRVVASDAIGYGPAFYNRVMSYDEVAKRVLVLDRSRRKLLAVDPATGDRSVVMSHATVGAGPVMRISGPADMIMDPAGDRILLLHRSRFATLTIVDVATGARQLVSGEDAGSGVTFQDPWGLALDEAGNRALVLDNYRSALLAVDLATGERTVLVSGLGDGLVKAQYGLVFDAATRRAYYDETTYEGSNRLAAVVAVDLVTGARTVLSDATRGAGPILQEASTLVLDKANGRLLVIEYYTGQVVAVDLVTGDRSILSLETAGAPTSLAGSMHATLDVHGNRLIAFVGPSWALEPLVAVDIATGARTVLADPGGGSGTGPLLWEQGALASSPRSGLVYLFDGANSALLALDPATEERIVISR